MPQLPEAAQTQVDDILDHVNGLIYPTTNGYENAMRFNLHDVQIKLKAYLQSQEFMQAIKFIRSEGVAVHLIDTTLLRNTEPEPDEAGIFKEQCTDPNTLYLTSAPAGENLPLIFLYSHDTEIEGGSLLDSEELANLIKQDDAAYKTLVENKKIIKQQLHSIRQFIENSRTFFNPDPITPLDLPRLDKLIDDFNQHWGKLLPLAFKLTLKKGKASAKLSGMEILSTSDFPVFSQFMRKVPVKFDPATAYNTKPEHSVTQKQPSTLTQCGLFGATVAGVALVTAMIQMRNSI